jgi:hypothetical protein
MAYRFVAHQQLVVERGVPLLRAVQLLGEEGQRLLP